MKKEWKIIALALLIIMTGHYVTKAQETNLYTLTVEVHDLRNNKGTVQIALYNREGTLPDEKYQRAFKIGQSKIVNYGSTYEFTSLPPGRYAVNILHDENNNHTIEKGLLRPKEGIGFSNYSTVGLRNRPSFEKAKFDVTGDRTILVKVIYF